MKHGNGTRGAVAGSHSMQCLQGHGDEQPIYLLPSAM